MDLGIKETVAATVVDSRFPDCVKNICISQGSQLDPERRGKRGLKWVKTSLKHGDIHELERSIKPIEYPQVDPSVQDDEDVWTALDRSAEVGILSVLRVARPLRQFYGSYQYRRNHRGLKLAQKATPNKAVDKLFSQLSCKGKWVFNSRNPQPRPVIVAGDGQFGSRSGGPIKHLKFFHAMKRRVILVNN
ncbi:hypothetical protein BGW39_006682 [Mortierella sp. 14UC]|nr:hypothetical protein BGW39_006682 [Mortierella sp. 14UC]